MSSDVLFDAVHVRCGFFSFGAEDISQYVDPKPLSRRPIFLMTCRGELGLPYKPNAGMSGREGVKRGEEKVDTWSVRPKLWASQVYCLWCPLENFQSLFKDPLGRSHKLEK